MRHDPWLTEISPADIEAAMQRKAAREALIAEQAAEIARLRARVAALEGALRPFANVGEFIAKHHPDPETDQNHETATLVRHFRNAYIALTGGKDE